LPADLWKHRLPGGLVLGARDRELRGLLYFGEDREEAARRAGMEAARRGWAIVDQEWDGFVLAVRIECPVQCEAATSPSTNGSVRAGASRTNAGNARRKYVVYRAGSRAAAKQRASADSDLYRWLILEAHWRPAPNAQGGALMLQVEEPDS